MKKNKEARGEALFVPEEPEDKLPDPQKPIDFNAGVETRVDEGMLLVRRIMLMAVAIPIIVSSFALISYIMVTAVPAVIRLVRFLILKIG